MSEKIYHQVNHPSHYNLLPAQCKHCSRDIECIDVVRHMNFNLGNVVKYIWRAGHKDGDPIVDLQKAAWYLQNEIERVQRLQTAALPEKSDEEEKEYFRRILDKKGLMPFRGQTEE